MVQAAAALSLDPTHRLEINPSRLRAQMEASTVKIVTTRDELVEELFSVGAALWSPEHGAAAGAMPEPVRSALCSRDAGILFHESHAIFNKLADGTAQPDGTRFQRRVHGLQGDLGKRCGASRARLFCTYVKDVMGRAAALLGSGFSANTHVVLASAAGGPQLAHADAKLGLKLLEALQAEPRPLPSCSALLALDDGCKIIVWPKSWATLHEMWKAEKGAAPPEKIEKQIVVIPKGHVLIFRQDLVHAGAGYEEDNLRAHAFLDNKELPQRRENTTELASFYEHADLVFV